MFAESEWFNRLGFLVFDTIDSTNLEARRIISNGTEEELVIWAKEQTNGKGKYERNWVSYKGNLFLSIVLNPNCALTKMSQLTFVTTIALGKTLEEILGPTKKINYKWPNDILVDHKKIAGILLETCPLNLENNKDNRLIIGVGVNIAESPNNLSYPTTNIKNEISKVIEASYVLDKFMQKFFQYYDLWQQKGFTPIRELWLDQALALGDVITVVTMKDRVSGVFEDMGHDGCIKLKVASGQVCIISAGEVFYNTDDHNHSHV